MGRSDACVLSGTVKRIVYRKDDFVIARLQPREGEGIVTIKGEYPDAQRDEGCRIEVTGYWVDDPKWGRQFRIVSTRNIEEEEDGLFYFLTKVVGHIDQKAAREIADKVGDFDRVMEESPELLLNIRGIGKKKLKRIKEGWRNYKKVRGLSELLAPHGITRATIMKVFEHFGDEAEDQVRKNPYVLTEIHGIGFRKADEVALKMGINPLSVFRIAAAIAFVMESRATDDGHTLCKETELFRTVREALKRDEDEELLSEERFREGMRRALDQGVIATIPTDEGEEAVYAAPKYRTMERYIYDKLKREKERPAMPLVGMGELREFIAEEERRMGGRFGESQKRAVEIAAEGYRVFAIGGYAGCGKTTISLSIIRLLSRFAGNKVVCCALSGVAAKRIESVTGIKGMTIHSLLRLGTDNEYDEKNPLDYDIVVLDEASMVDTYVFYRLLRAIDTERTRLIALGDPGQLPPVGAGAPYADILKHDLAHHVLLTEIYRQRDSQAIVSIASSVRKGEIPEELEEAASDRGRFEDVVVLDASPAGGWSAKKKAKAAGPAAERKLREEIDRRTLSYVEKIAQKALPGMAELAGRGAWRELTTYFQVAAPMRKGTVGIQNLNKVLQGILNPPKADTREVVIPDGRVFRVGDKVIHLKNENKTVIHEGGRSDEARVNNGQIGFILDIVKGEDGKEKIFVHYPNEEYSTYYAPGDLIDGKLDLAYALSVHKLQGNEAEYFVMVATWSHYVMLNARLLYTGVTRAKRRLYIVGELPAFFRGCQILDEIDRQTVLSFLASRDSGKPGPRLSTTTESNKKPDPAPFLVL